MNHKNTTLAIVVCIAVVAMTAIAFALPQQVFAYSWNTTTITTTA